MIPIVGIVGSRSNVGKTFVMENIIKELKNRDYKVATIKHDVHGFNMDQPGKDTWKHAEAGADTVIISSAKKMAMIKKVEVELTIEEIVEKITDVDIILVEGYKKSNLPKIEVFSADICKELYCDKKDLIAVASDVDIKIDGVAVCNKEDASSLVDIIEQKIIGKAKK